MYHVDLDGNTFFEKISFLEERIDLIDNPLLGHFMRRKDEIMVNPELREEVSRIAVYYLNLH